MTTFRKLHEGFLVLPNAWDAASARVVAECGAAAIATSSAAMAWVHGKSDGEKLEPALLIAAVREMAGATSLPLSVDLERGYGGALAAIVDAGAVGVNLEDGTSPPELLAEAIAAARRIGGSELYINARTDVYLRNLSDEPVAETLRRARLYADAGADGLFVPGVVAPAEIAEIAGGTPLPLNVLLRPQLAPPSELRRLGVHRLSVGCALAQAALGLVRRATRQLLEGGSYTAIFDADAISVKELNGWFTA
jgi:2-methylisocitrate lyase-like PEP mutase family enzyme